MNKKKLLAENFIIYGLGQILYKVIPIIMLPFLVRIMPDSSYYMGINDLANTLVSLVAVVGLMGLYDGTFRLFFDYDDQQYEQRQRICSTALCLTIIFSTICFCILVLFRKEAGRFLFEDERLSWLTILCGVNVILTNVENILLTPVRMLNERKRFIIGNTIISVFSYSTAIVFVMKKYYIIALPLGMTLSLLLGIVYFGYYNRKWFKFHAVSTEYIIPLLKIGIPLFPTFLIFWIFSSFDKVMILKMLDIGANGRFSVANKLAQISQLITAAFAAGWSYFNFATMRDEKRIEDFSRIMEFIMVLGIGAFLFCRISGNMVMKIFFPSEYSGLGDVFAYLFLAPIVCMMFQLMGSQFLLIKKTILSTLISGVGVVANILLNYFWIMSYHILGAAIATVVSYVFIVIIASIVLKRKHMIEFNWRYLFLGVVFVIIVCMDLLNIEESKIYIVGAVMLIGIFVVYIKVLLSYRRQKDERLL